MQETIRIPRFHWIDSSLSTRFLLGMLAGLVAISLVFLILFSSMYHTQLERNAQQTALQLNKLFQAALENAMLKRDIEGLREIVQRLGAQDRIAAVTILHPSGEIRFSSDSRMVGRRLAANGDAYAGLDNGPRGMIGFITDVHGQEVLRSAIAVPNRDECFGCHGSKAINPINGVLVVDYDATPIREHARDTTLALMGAGSVVVLLTLLGGWWFMRRFILRPVAALTGASKDFARGKRDTRVLLPGKDELSQLADTFNRMADDVDASLRAKQENEAFLQAVIDGIPDGIRVVGANYRVVKANRAYRALLGNPDGEIVGRPCFETSHGRSDPCPATLDNCPLDIISRRREPVKCVQRFKMVEGQDRHVEVYAAPIVTGHPDDGGRTMIVESIRNLDQTVRFSHEQKLSALGQLAAGVAHEIHNPLSSIRFALQASMRSLRQESPDLAGVESHLVLIDEEINRCIEITGRLLRLGALPSEYPELVTVNSVLTDTISLLQDEARGRGICIEFDLDPSNPRVVAGDADLRMIVLNLAQNAFHAMTAGGRLLVATRGTGEQVELWIDDTGVGVNPADLPRIFDPFFGRRADGSKGAGLGLAIVKNIVERHGGRVALQPLVPLGTRARVVFPGAQSQSICPDQESE